MAAAVCFTASANAADDAKKTWESIVNPKDRKKSVFRYVQNDPNLPNVLIYGDSISMGYTDGVRALLKGQANVYRIPANGGDTVRVIPLMKKMHEAMGKHWSFTWDVIHFNCGLHDLKYLDEKRTYNTKTGTQVRSPEVYAKELEKIFAYFKSIAPDAKVVFATTTPVPERSRGRKAGDGKRFNDAAMKLLKKHPEIVVNDLYGLVKPNHEKWMASRGNVHFGKKANEALAKQVASMIQTALKKNKE
jgi:hypothetical protein